MAYSEDVNVNLNVLTGTMGGVTAIMGGMSALTSSFGAMGTEAANTFGALDGLLVTSTALIVGFAAKSAEAFGEYEQGMKIVQTVSNQSSAAIGELRDKANELSIEYRTAIGDITDGLQTLGRAGLNSVTEQLDVLESGLQTAKLEGRSLNGVLEELIQNTAMLGGDLKSTNFGEQSEYVNSLLVGTSMTAPITSHDISQTLQYAGGTAAAAGANINSAEGQKKLEDLMGTVAAFAQKGVTGSMAGTALRAFFTKPASQDASVTKGLSAIGLSPEDLWEDGGESMKSVSDQISIIQHQMDKLNLSTMDQIEIWGKIVGAKMGQQMMKLDSSTIKDLTRDIQSAQSAEDLATQTLQTYTQKLAEMQQQGDLAFREFGEKAAQWLTPVIEIVTQILGLLSNPWINTGVFVLVGSLLAHGLRKAWAMATTVFNQIRALIGEAISGVESFNAMAGGSATGFAQSASAVEVLNARLAQTNQELAAMQAKFLGIKPVTSTGGYVPPLGLTNSQGKLLPHIIGTAHQEVFVGNGIGSGKDYVGMGKQGMYYDRSEMDSLKQQYKNDLIKRNELHNQRLDNFYKNSITKDARGQIHYTDPNSDTPSRFISKKQWEQNEAAMLKANPILSSKEINKQVDSATKIGQGKIHSSLMSMTEKEYKQWYKGLDDATKRLEKGASEYYKNGKFDQAAYERDQLRAFNKMRQDEFMKKGDPSLTTRTVNGQRFYRAFNLSRIRERLFEEERAMQKDPQLREYENTRARSPGMSTYQRAQDIGTRRLNAWNKVITSGTDKIKGFGTGIANAGRSVTSFGSSVWMGAKKAVIGLDTMMPQLEAKALSGLEKINVAETSMTVALEELRAMTGLSAAEFEVLFANSEKLSFEFAKLYAAAEGDAYATSEEIAAREVDAKAALQEATAREANQASSLMGSLGNGIKGVVGLMGGPFMAAMMGATIAMQAISTSQQQWQERMQEASTDLSEAKEALSQAEENIQETYKSEFDNLSDADAEKVTDYQYAAIQEAYKTKGAHAKFSDMYDNEVVKVENLTWTEEEKEKNEVKTGEELAKLNDSTETLTLTNEENILKLEENTQALNSATYQYSQALQKSSLEATDGVWGFDSFGSEWSDTGGILNIFQALPNLVAMKINDVFGGDLITGNKIPTIPQMITRATDFLGLTQKQGYFDSDSPVLTASQQDKNNPFGTDFASVLAEDLYKEGTVEGLEQFFGDDYDRIIGLMGGIDNKISANGQLTGAGVLNTYGDYFSTIPAKDLAMGLTLLKDNPDAFSTLGKTMFRVEQQSDFKGPNAIQRYDEITEQSKKVTKGTITTPGTKEFKNTLRDLPKNLSKNLKKTTLSVYDKNLKSEVQKFSQMTGGKLDEHTILALGSLQQLADMDKIASEYIVPGVNAGVSAAYQNVSATNSAGSNAGSAADGASLAGANAKAIAAKIGAGAQEGAEHEAFREYLKDPNAETDWFGNKYDENKFISEVNKPGSALGKKYGDKMVYSLEYESIQLEHSDWSPTKIAEAARKGTDAIMKSDASLQAKMNTATWGITKYGEKTVKALYDQSKIGEYGGDSGASGGSGGGGSGSGGGGSNSNTGSTRSRVDLVLCNKKTIPKLNVNLFKKPPNFTIKNKNFKIRDIKINSEDKPDAITDAIKDGIIKAQKRMDPKIIQSDQAVYDPVTATDGTTTPSGNTPVSSK